MSNNLGTVRNIRVFVEPVDVELDEDGGLLWTSLQTAFPGCSGLFYKDREADCRSSVKFDGQKFRSPGGAWNDRTYYAALSQRCHAANGQAFGTYESATKQFEKSVLAVQKLIGGSMFDPDKLRERRERTSSRRIHSPTPTTPEAPTIRTTAAVTTTESLLQSTSDRLAEQSAQRELTPLEHQFAELAKICTGKDKVIEQHRATISELEKKNTTLESELKSMKTRFDDLQQRLTAYENELDMLRKMGSEQTSMITKVGGLSKDLDKKDVELKELRESMENKLSAARVEIEVTKEKNSAISLKLQESEDRVKQLAAELYTANQLNASLTQEVEKLRPLAAVVDVEDYGRLEPYSVLLANDLKHKELLDEKDETIRELSTQHRESEDLYNGAARENTILTKRNADLEARVAKFDEELSRLHEGYTKQQEEMHERWNAQKVEAEQECEDLKKQLGDLQHMLESATKDATEASRRSMEIQIAKDELERNHQASSYKQQDEFRREIRVLAEKLQKAEGREGELRYLVSTLSSDAHHSQGIINDII